MTESGSLRYIGVVGPSHDVAPTLLAQARELGLQVPTADLPHHLGDLRSIDHVTVPGSWQIVSAERVSVVRDQSRLSDHDAYVVEVAPRDTVS